MRESKEQKLSANYKKGTQSSCWEWLGKLAWNGYGKIHYYKGYKNYCTTYAHIVSWEIFNSAIKPINKVIMHTCDNRRCVNPNHLKLGTQQENLQDMRNKKRDSKIGLFKCGKDNKNSKLTSHQVIEIINSKISNRKLAKVYNVSHGTIGQIKRREYYKWII